MRGFADSSTDLSALWEGGGCQTPPAPRKEMLSCQAKLWAGVRAGSGHAQRQKGEAGDR